MVEVEEDCPIREGAMIDVLTEPSIVIMVMDITRRHTPTTPFRNNDFRRACRPSRLCHAHCL